MRRGLDPDPSSIPGAISSVAPLPPPTYPPNSTASAPGLAFSQLVAPGQARAEPVAIAVAPSPSGRACTFGLFAEGPVRICDPVSLAVASICPTPRSPCLALGRIARSLSQLLRDVGGWGDLIASWRRSARPWSATANSRRAASPGAGFSRSSASRRPICLRERTSALLSFASSSWWRLRSRRGRASMASLWSR